MSAASAVVTTFGGGGLSGSFSKFEMLKRFKVEARLIDADKRSANCAEKSFDSAEAPIPQLPLHPIEVLGACSVIELPIVTISTGGGSWAIASAEVRHSVRMTMIDFIVLAV
jgi:hypothetical protein